MPGQTVAECLCEPIFATWAVGGRVGRASKFTSPGRGSQCELPRRPQLPHFGGPTPRSFRAPGAGSSRSRKKEKQKKESGVEPPHRKEWFDAGASIGPPCRQPDPERRPPPGSVSNPIVPPWASTMLLQIASPSPVPPVSRRPGLVHPVEPVERCAAGPRPGCRRRCPRRSAPPRGLLAPSRTWTSPPGRLYRTRWLTRLATTWASRPRRPGPSAGSRPVASRTPRPSPADGSGRRRPPPPVQLDRLRTPDLPASARARVNRPSTRSVIRSAARRHVSHGFVGIRPASAAATGSIPPGCGRRPAGVRSSCEASAVNRACRSNAASSRPKVALSTRARSASSRSTFSGSIRSDRLSPRCRDAVSGDGRDRAGRFAARPATRRPARPPARPPPVPASCQANAVRSRCIPSAGRPTRIVVPPGPGRPARGWPRGRSGRRSPDSTLPPGSAAPTPTALIRHPVGPPDGEVHAVRAVRAGRGPRAVSAARALRARSGAELGPEVGLVRRPAPAGRFRAAGRTSSAAGAAARR